MQVLTSKAYYLKNYIPKKAKKAGKLKTQGDAQKLPSLAKHASSTIQELNIEHLAQARKKSNYSHSHKNSQYSKSAHSTNSFVHHSHTNDNTKYKDFNRIVQREREILKKVVQSKLSNNRSSRSKRVHTIGSQDTDYILIQKHPLSDVNTIEVESMKPTQRYFHMMNNVRLAQKLLLSKPTSQVSTQHCKQFYHKQNQYKTNISKLGFRSRKESELSRLKLLNRRKWLD